jgi:hypothetical protein
MDSKISIIGKAGHSTVLHHLPCTISLDGPARVNAYFVPETTAEGGCAGIVHERKTLRGLYIVILDLTVQRSCIRILGGVS